MAKDKYSFNLLPGLDKCMIVFAGDQSLLRVPVNMYSRSYIA